MTDPGLAVCLSSSFLGHYAHAGFLTGLEERGLHPGRIAGSSGGAIAGGLWAAGVRGEPLERILFSLNFRRAFFDLGAFWRLWGVLSWSYSPGVLCGRRMERYLDQLFGNLRIEECDPKLEIAVANLTRGRGEIRDHGVLRDFIIASFSMPLIYKPRRIEGEDFLDGGVSNGTPFDHWLKDPQVHTILVHRILHADDCSSTTSPCGILAACHTITWNELFERRRKEAEASGKRVIFVETIQPRPRLFSGSSAREHFAAGEVTAGECVRRLGVPAEAAKTALPKTALKHQLDRISGKYE